MNVYDRIYLERQEQERLFIEKRLAWIASDPECPNELRLAALVEEVGEVARAFHDGKGLETELVQVAAVAVAWLEGLRT